MRVGNLVRVRNRPELIGMILERHQFQLITRNYVIWNHRGDIVNDVAADLWFDDEDLELVR
jgi:hypothetical protein